MQSYEHKKLIERVSEVDRIPKAPVEYAQWINAGAHLELLRANAKEDELIIYAVDRYHTLIQSVIVSRQELDPLDRDDLLKWSGNLCSGCASYTWTNDRDDVSINRRGQIIDTKSLATSRGLVFVRQDEDRTYLEISQEYAHITGIHWRDTHGSYGRLDRRGDWDPVVSATPGDMIGKVTLASFKREPLEEYLEASGSTLVRLFTFKLMKKSSLSPPDGPGDPIENDTLFYRHVKSETASYTQGVQIVHPRRPRAAIRAAIRGESVRTADSYVEFITWDFRNSRIANISTAPEATTNFYAQKNDLPYELSPAFFNSEVLSRFYGDRDKYVVGERNIACHGSWDLRGHDVNEAGQVHAYICDLRTLPGEEQLYWKSFNEKPKGGISSRAIKNDFQGKWEYSPDALSEIRFIMKQWSESKCVWWKSRDEKLVDSVYTPRTNSRDQWAKAFTELAKLTVECFDTRGIRIELKRRGIEWTKDEECRSLALIERLVDGNLDGLRAVQRVRSKVDAHVRGSEADSLSNNALKHHGSYAAHFEHVCRDVIDELEHIERAFNG